MLKLILLPVLLLVIVGPVSASTALLPDSGTYYYWIRSKSGAVQSPPHRSLGATAITIPDSKSDGSTLYVLDPHTGGIAAVTLTAKCTSAMTIDQFHLPEAAPPSQGQTNAAAVIPTATAPKPAGESTLSRVVTGIFSLALLGGVIWFVRALYLSRGQLLIDAAKKVGVDVPNPADPIPTAVGAEGKYEPPPVPKVQKIPDDAYKAPTAATAANGYLITPDGTSFAVGRKPIRIGREPDNEIVISDPSVSRHHAVVELLSGTVQITDQGSANGVEVNGQRVSSAILQPGVRLKIGQVPLRFEA